MGLSRTQMLAGIQKLLTEAFEEINTNSDYEIATNTLYQNKVNGITDLTNKTLKTTLSLKIGITGFFIEFEADITNVITELRNKLLTVVDPPDERRHPILYYWGRKLMQEHVVDSYKKFQKAVTKIRDSVALKSVSVGYSNDKLSIFSHIFGMTIKFHVDIKDKTKTPLEINVEVIKDGVIKIKENLGIE